MRIGWIIEFPGQRAGEHARDALRLALENPPEGTVGFGIGGIEAGRAPFRELIRDVFAAAAAAGLHSVPHAGETTGPETVWEAVSALRAERIGHGIRILDDPALVAYLAERQLPVDVSPTSNVCTRCVPSLAAHPLRRMAEAGLVVTLNSDDPPMFGTSLSNEYLVAGRDLGFSPAELAGLAASGVRHRSSNRRRSRRCWPRSRPSRCPDSRRPQNAWGRAEPRTPWRCNSARTRWARFSAASGARR